MVTTYQEYFATFFAIDVFSLNLFSFMLGATWAFFNQGFFGKRIGFYVFLYFAALASWFGLKYFLLLNYKVIL